MGRLTEAVKGIIVVNVIFYIGSMLIGEPAYKIMSLYYFENPNFQIWQPITHMFMHDSSSIMHILFNMLALFWFGVPLEDNWGTKKFLFFYFSAGLGAFFLSQGVTWFSIQQATSSLLEAGMNPNDINDFFATGQYSQGVLNSISLDTLTGYYRDFNTPSLGASGAVYGVAAAFVLFYPNVELMMLFLPIPIKAKYMITGLLVANVISGISGYPLLGENVGVWAHVGGAIIGLLMAYYWKKNSFNNTRWD